MVAFRRRRTPPPLPIRDGLNPSRVRVPEGTTLTAQEFLSHLILSQRHRHPEDNSEAILARFHAGEVRLRDGQALAPGDTLRPGTDVWFYRTPAPEKPVPYEIRIIHEDESLLVVDKPPFLATMPRGEHITETATVRLRRLTGNNDLTPAHRLDRLTSGLLLFTKRPEIRGAYQELFASRKVTKTYEAIAPYDAALAAACGGFRGSDSGEARVEHPVEWRSHITKTPGDLQARTWPEREPNAHTTLLGIRPDPDGKWAAYTLRPHTGKTHQLRMHMAAAGVPIQGDPLYPVVRREEEDFNKPLRLRAIGLEFIDPLNGEKRVYSV
ncbi:MULTISPECIES: pseudouridine synthase [unclassified Corynebacterium]|uniref:pseudouridine synthase n=1 Tax=unclassified Corynebacterium TaxID=2624378 RepID=UPI0029C9BACD|nr:MULTISPECIES: pseudouridine synthase [unclassified Corynebacterium]WPF66080.1 pseudouridine synthase [Corynebacterium sp. 22KM0430]WPF68572.1 pseudouridine synthase [Corynebacterium sp. 21KM1197]